MKVYQCNACGKIIKDPYKIKMKEFSYKINFEDNISRDKTKVKIDLCEECFKGLHLLIKKL